MYFSRIGPHSSKATPEPHATVDVHGKNMRPIGTLHVFLPQGRLSGRVESYETIRTKAQDVSFLGRNFIQ